MKDTQKRHFLMVAMSAAALVAVAPAWSQAFPDKPIRLIVSAPPGGGTDAMARTISTGLGEAKQWQLVVENLPGAGGNLGMRQVATARKDGYTLGMGESSNLIINPYLYSKLPFDIEKDLTPVIRVARVPLVLVVGINSGHNSVDALIETAKQRSLFFASAGNGTVGHLTGELWKRKIGVQATHVPYKGAAPAMADVAGGQVDFFFASITSALPLIQAGKVRPLAVTSTSRAPLMPDVPSLHELGQKDMEASVVFGVVAPTGTPADVIEKLNAATTEIFKSPKVRQTLVGLGADETSIGSDVSTFAELLRDERSKWSEIVVASGARVD